MIVKVQIPVAHNFPPECALPVLVYNSDNSLRAYLALTPELARLLGTEPKQFWFAEHDPVADSLRLIRRARWQEW